MFKASLFFVFVNLFCPVDSGEFLNNPGFETADQYVVLKLGCSKVLKLISKDEGSSSQLAEINKKLIYEKDFCRAGIAMPVLMRLTSFCVGGG